MFYTQRRYSNPCQKEQLDFASNTSEIGTDREQISSSQTTKNGTKQTTNQNQ
jgi:hypothetical protein